MQAVDGVSVERKGRSLFVNWSRPHHRTDDSLRITPLLCADARILGWSRRHCVAARLRSCESRKDGGVSRIEQATKVG